MSRSKPQSDVPRRNAAGVIELLVDPGSFVSWDSPAGFSTANAAYAEALATAARKAGTDESVVTGAATIVGRRLALIVSEFAFLGGSIGEASANRVVAAIRRATTEGLPILGMPASGGTRMQEGTPAFVRMPEIARAIADHRAAGLAYVAYLRHPTTGGVFATWGSLGQLTWGEPKALVGFLGPKVYELLKGKPFPQGVQTSEHLAKMGVIDDVVPLEELRDRLAPLLGLIVEPTHWGLAEVGPNFTPTIGEEDGWTAIQRTRDPGRPGLRELLASPFISDMVVLHGSQAGERDETVLLALARLHGKTAVIVGQDRAAQRSDELGPAALRIAQRGIRLAEELRLPLLAVIDTPGARLSKTAEEQALAPEIARTLAAMTTLTVPNMSVLLGQGCGGAALALFPARHIVAVDDAWLTPLPPEGASAIVHGDIEHAPDMARAQGITAHDLWRSGVVHRIVPMDEVLLAAADALWRQRNS